MFKFDLSALWHNVILLFIGATIFLQCEPTKNFPENVSDLIFVAEHLEKQARGDSAISLYKKAMEIAKNDGDRRAVMDLHNRIARNLLFIYELEQAKSHLDSTISLTRGETQDYQEIGTVLDYYGAYQEVQENYDSALFYFNKSLQIRHQYLDSQHHHVAESYVSLAWHYGNARKEYSKAFEYLEVALPIRVKHFGDQSEEAGECYANMAYLYAEIGDFEKAILFQKKVNAIFERNLASNSYSVLYGHSNLAKYYQNLGQFEQALMWFEKIIGTEKNEENKYIIADTYSEMAICYQQSDPNKSKKLLFKSLRESKQLFGEQHSAVGSVHRLLGNFYSKENNYDSALHHFVIAKNIYAQRQGENSVAYADICTALSVLHSARKDWNASIFWTQKAIKAMATDSTNLQEVSGLSLRPETYEALYLKSKVHYKIGGRRSLEASFRSSLLAIQIIEEIKREYTGDQARNILSDKTTQIFEHAAEVAFELFKVSGKNYYKEKAFEIAEKNRSFNLLIEVLKSNAQQFAGIPKEVLEMEKKLKNELSYYRNQVFTFSRDPYVSKEKNERYQEQLIRFEIKYDQFTKELEEKYPTYYRLKNSNVVTSVTQIQEKLKKEEALVEYFNADRYLMIFLITKNSFKVINQEKSDTINKSIKDFRIAINKYDKELFIKNSSSLYKMLIDPILPHLSKKISTLRVVPHNEIAFVSFDCLVTNKGEENDYQDLHYLLENFNIIYQYTATIPERLRKVGTERAYNSIALFAPVFDHGENKRQLIPLLESEEEVRVISQLFDERGHDNQFFLREEATKESFMKNGEKTSIIHLATHTEMNKQDINQSVVHFFSTQENNVDEMLTLSETYGLNLSPDLLTLSSCESGFGTLVKGEGVLSFTRGFSYGGTKNIICSLWKVNDFYTRRTMIDLYTSIVSSSSYPEALKEAKLSLLNENRNLSPKEWAGFVLIEN